MAFDTYTPLFSETLEKVGKLKTKKEKIELQKKLAEVVRALVLEELDVAVHQDQ